MSKLDTKNTRFIGFRLPNDLAELLDGEKRPSENQTDVLVRTLRGALEKPESFSSSRGDT